MMKKSARQQSPPQKGSDRVSAWIHTVINPLIEALRIEKKFLDDRNWTWRYLIGELEFIRPLKFYLDQPMWHNFDDFLRANPKFQKQIDGHDQLLDKLTKECQKASGDLVTSKSFQGKVGKLRSNYQQGGEDYPGGKVPEKDFTKLVAQYLVNNIKELPEYYTISKFWSRFGEELLHFRTGQTFQVLNKAGEQLEKYDVVLIKKLKDLQFEFCQKYDIPAAPLPYMRQVG
ncbi:MAG: hypothetical protein HZA19_01610 [Nitrospirae bacterium]|nr:hypothetical protein [Nitrospirota bacterium]